MEKHEAPQYLAGGTSDTDHAQTPTPIEPHRKRNAAFGKARQYGGQRMQAFRWTDLIKEWQTDVKASIVEFMGTVMFLLFGLGGVQAAAASQNAAAANAAMAAINTSLTIEQLLYISTSFGLSLVVSAWAFYRVSGSVFNPNVATALFLTGVIGPLRFVLYVIAELVGAIVASAILQGILPGTMAFAVAPSNGTNKAQAVFIEVSIALLGRLRDIILLMVLQMFLTSGLILTVLLLAAEKHKSTYLAPIGIGLALFIGQLFGVFYTGAAMSTCRAFGPAVVLGFDDSQWIYWLGPFLGSLLAVAIYLTLKILDYETFVPTQDSDKRDHSAQPIQVYQEAAENLRQMTSGESARSNSAA